MAHVTDTSVRRLVGLGHGIPLAHEEVGSWWCTQPARQGADEFERLIEPALAQTGWVQGHRDEGVGFFRRREGADQRLAERLGEAKPVAVFVRLEQSVEGVGVAEHGAHPVKMPSVLEAGSAGCSIRARTGAARTRWFGGAWERGVARGTDRNGAVHGLAAEQAILRVVNMVTITDWSHGHAFKSLLRCTITLFWRVPGFYWCTSCLLSEHLSLQPFSSKVLPMNTIAIAPTTAEAVTTPDAAKAVPAKWTVSQVEALYQLPLMDLLYRAQQVHRENFDPNEVQRSSLISIKTGGCPEDCNYCSQSARYKATEREALMQVDEVLAAAREAKAKGASRFCMGAAWRGPKEKELEVVTQMIREVKSLGMETCVTLGMLKDGQAEQLKAAGLDYYNHNLDTDAEFYDKVITTHTHADRVDTISKVRGAGIKVCSGGILGMGESRRNRAAMVAQLANLNPAPDSVPINNLVAIPGTPLAEKDKIDGFEFLRTIAAARITMPKSFVRLSAGREAMSDEMQAMCFFAGANSIFYCDKLLTTSNSGVDRDQQLFEKLGLRAI